ncbi:hypothetical protein [Amycolatopsis sp. DSM 110486]|uniref:hypothetical protein n=1 Tax=Amycolatopsis sp. DSM 110486 TaxID=2865832 RepID=UPI001C697E38|nr:hypothetical protein [Amycolatopsis sp. DSM 110486]QYN17560.1 hypothetical protein K1T34_32765 [Amycolatopsis sp. DSM 110486]
MHLTRAVKIVADHTRECTDPKMDDRAAITCARTQMSRSDLSVVDSRQVRQAYVTVLDASDDDIAAALH